MYCAVYRQIVHINIEHTHTHESQWQPEVAAVRGCVASCVKIFTKYDISVSKIEEKEKTIKQNSYYSRINKVKFNFTKVLVRNRRNLVAIYDGNIQQ